MANALLGEFHKYFGPGGPVFRAAAPGRVNLIGEHTDYNGGYVLPMALDRRTTILARPNRSVSLHDARIRESATFDLDGLERTPKPFWVNYPKGVASVLQKAGFALKGFDGLLTSEVPIGAGLSSSAAIEVATAMAFCAVSGIEIEKMRLAKLCQQAENEFVGMRCGIMDQFIAVFGRIGHAVLLDCETMAHEAVPLDPSHTKIIVCNTGVKHELAASAYNERRGQCEEAIRLIEENVSGTVSPKGPEGAAQKRFLTPFPHVHSFHDLTPELFEQAKELLDGVFLKRARHVVGENARALAAVAALKAGRPEEFGRLMNASHDSLRDDYEVSCQELDVMVELARKTPGTLGARMTGAGFGGCTVNLVRRDAVAHFCETVPKRYQQLTGIAPTVYVVEPGGGAEVEELE